jgi:hypothetical protein
MLHSPDHEPVVTAGRIVTGIRCGEEIVRDIGVDVGVVVAPLNRGGNSADVAHVLLVHAIHAVVGIALDAGALVGPVSTGLEGDAGVGDVADRGTLRTRALVLTPEIVIYNVWAALKNSVLGTCLLAGEGGGRQRQERSQGLHHGEIKGMDEVLCRRSGNRSKSSTYNGRSERLLSVVRIFVGNEARTYM